MALAKDFIKIDEDFNHIITSIDNVIELQLARNRQTFTVKYPAAVEEFEEEPTTLEEKLKKEKIKVALVKKLPITYIWIEQAFSVLEPPPYWLVARKSGQIVASNYVVVPIPQANGDAAPSHSLNAQFHPSVDACLQPLNPKPIKLHWTETALFRILSKNDDDDFDIEAVLHSDGAVIRSSESFNFMNVFVSELDPSSEGDIYPSSILPEFITNFITGQKYNLTSLKTTMLKLYHNACHCLAEYGKARSSELEFIEKAPTIPSEGFVLDGVGQFDVLPNGSVRVVFEDETLIEVDNPEEILPFCLSPRQLHVVVGTDKFATVTNREGARYQLRMSRPIGYEPYVDFAFSIVRLRYGDVLSNLSLCRHMSYVIQFIWWLFDESSQSMKNDVERQKFMAKMTESITKGLQYLRK
ncbi:hypothetical protein HDU97_001688 [Phlyctochytrium planicorne]|nr:hypothetical protein HDU97_001688 [Phlyctochytrium planicorne]